jgi:hypothetical protein
MLGNWSPVACLTGFITSIAANNFAKGTSPQFFPCVEICLNQE